MPFKDYQKAVAEFRIKGGEYPDFRKYGITEQKALNAERALSREQSRGPNRFKGRNRARAKARKSR
jgi:hypothetical protein